MSDVTTGEIDPKSSVSYRSLRAVVIVLGVLIALALALVVVGVSMKLSGHSPSAQADAANKFQLPPGAKITSVQVVQNRMVMAVQMQGGNRVYLFSTDDGHLVSQVVPNGQ